MKKVRLLPIAEDQQVKISLLKDKVLYEAKWWGNYVDILNFWQDGITHGSLDIRTTEKEEDPIEILVYTDGGKLYQIEPQDRNAVIYHTANRLIRNLTFYKTEENRWYANIPEWEGSVDELEMVAGADIMLDIYSQFENRITLTMSDLPLKRGDLLKRVYDPTVQSGSNYKVTTMFQQPYDYEIWLCDVTKFVFGRFPENIYIRP